MQHFQPFGPVQHTGGVQAIEQTEAIKRVKRKITDLDAMKIQEQKKAVRSRPCSCWSSSRTRAQLYFCATPAARNTSLLNFRWVSAMFRTRNVTMKRLQGGGAMYYGVNAKTHNMIMLDRKLARCPNGLKLGTPGSGKSMSMCWAVRAAWRSERTGIFSGLGSAR